MAFCPAVHYHSEFEKSYNPNNKKQKYEVDKLCRYLKSNCGDAAGEQLKYEFTPFKSFPRGKTDLRCLFILCKDCKAEILKKKCKFCRKSDHTMNDAVLFFIGDHNKAYQTIGKRLILQYKKG